MSNKFNPDDLKNPLYEHSQVITVRDLQIIYHGLVSQYKDSKWWEVRLRHDLSLAGRIVFELISWLHDGKPTLREPGE